LKHLCSVPPRNAAEKRSSLSELILRRAIKALPLWQSAHETGKYKDFEKAFRNRDDLFSCTYSNSKMNQQKSSHQQLLATQLFYARLFQTQLSEPNMDSKKSSEYAINMVNRSDLRKPAFLQEDLLPTPSSQDNNNNIEIDNDVDDCFRCDDLPSFQFSNLNQTLSNLNNRKINELENIKRFSHFNTNDKNPNDFNKQHTCEVFQEHRNVLIDVKNRLEQLCMLSADFRQYHVDRNNGTDSALQATVRQQLNSNCKTIEGILDQVKQLYHQWSSAELYYLRSLQRLGLNSVDGTSSTQTHTIMALAAIALSEDSITTNKTNIQKDCVYHKQQDNKSELDSISALEKPKTLNEVENIILRLASTVKRQKSSETSHSTDGYSANAKSDCEDLKASPTCIWHPSNGIFRTNEEVENCNTAAEIILEYASSPFKSNLCMSERLPTNFGNFLGDDFDSNENITAINRSPVVMLNDIRDNAALSILNGSELFSDKLSVTHLTPPSSNNGGCSIENISGILGIAHNRRKSRFARRLEMSSSESSKPLILKRNCDEEFSSKHKILTSMAKTASIMSPPVSMTTSSTIAAVTAIQERAISNMFKARLNALTTVACINNDGQNGNTESEILPMLDAPYDLSIGTKIKNINLDTKNSSNVQVNDAKDNSNDKKKPHIKKPLNAFMLYMKEMRAKVVAECTLKESAAINQILGRRWHELSREEQSKYYEKARQERQLHMELYPGWSARDNYGYVSKKKKRKKDRSTTDSGGNNMKKCRARFGLDQQNQWCKPCRRKKKCIRYMEAINGNGSIEDGSGIDDPGSQISDDDDDDDDDNHLGGSCGSADESNKLLDDDTESLNQSLSSPGCLSSLQSPTTTMSLASPLNMNINTITPALFPANSNSLLINNGDQSSAQQRPTSVSTSGSSSGSTCSISTTPNTSSTVSPVTNTTGPSPISAHDRAMLLGNRFSHLGMGLSSPVISTSSNNPDSFLQAHHIVSNNAFSLLPTNVNSNLKHLGVLTKVPVNNVSRNPIGANPRDINNPLSIGQLTKKREDQNMEFEASASQTIVAHAATSILHHVTTHSYHVNQALLNRSFSQHFHQHLGSPLEAAKGSESTILAGGGAHSVNSRECHKTSEAQANASSSAPSGGASETGAITVS
ncbi:hypothetical protein KR009_010645, partial [Drosophila setifemur]